MLYCGIAVGTERHHLCTLEEVREAEPPIRLPAVFYEPGAALEVAAAVRSLGDVTVAVAAPLTAPPPGHSHRRCDELLRARGIAPAVAAEQGLHLRESLSHLPLFAPVAQALEGTVGEGAFEVAPLIETNSEGVFSALQGRRMPARRHPLGIQRRIQELEEDHVVDEGGELWHRRIDEIEAAAAALAAHRYAVAHACWVGDAHEGVIVLPGFEVPEHFPKEGVMPAVARMPLDSR